MDINSIKEEFKKYDVNDIHLDRYINFIKNSNCNDAYFEKHHILPKGKSFWPQYKSLNLYKWNEKKLSLRQHFIAHKILIQVFNDPMQKRSMISALMKMKKDKNMIMNSRYYEQLSIHFKELMSNHNPMKCQETVEIQKQKLNDYWNSDKGIKRKCEISYKMKGKPLSEEKKIKLSEYWKGIEKGPKTKDHIDNHRKAISKGKFITPWGEFWSPKQAADDDQNLEKLSRGIIDKKCKLNIDNFRFIPKDQINS